MSAQPDDLRLVDALLDGMGDEYWDQLRADAAAELRRLHAENVQNSVIFVEQQRELSKALDQRDELLAALKAMVRTFAKNHAPAVDSALAAIAKVEGGAA